MTYIENDIFNWVNDNIIKPVTTFVTNIVEDASNFDFYNQSESKVLESHYFSAYKGVPVLRTDADRSMSFGMIFLSREPSTIAHPEDDVRHEYGHTIQMKQLVLLKYVVDIGIPSALNLGHGDYYDKPWEVTADIYGGVKSRLHSREKRAMGYAYLVKSRLVGPFIWRDIK